MLERAQRYSTSSSECGGSWIDLPERDAISEQDPVSERIL